MSDLIRAHRTATAPWSTARWSRVADAAVAVCVFLTSLVTVAVSALEDGQDLTLESVADQPLPAVLLLGGAAAALLWRRRHPVGVTVAVLGLMLGWSVAGYGDGQEVALIVAVYGVGRYTTDSRRTLMIIIAAMAISVAGTIIDPQQRVDIAPAILLTAVPWYLGRRVHERGAYLELLQERAERLEADQQARARQAVEAERSRIARELHDVVAHRVSMMTVQAGAARTIARDDLDAALDAMVDVEQAGRQALGELRHVLGVLRRDVADTDGLMPQPGLAGISELVADLTHTGAQVRFASAELPQDLPAAVELSAYRIVQESLTNIVKHAGPSPLVDIDLTLTGSRIVITISNTVAGGVEMLPVSGYGLAGMRERAALLGGTLTAGPRPPNHFHVHATLPLEPEPT